jgi:glutathione synthase
MKPLLFIVNDLKALTPEKTTTALVFSAMERGHPTWVAGCADLYNGDSGPLANVRRVQTDRSFGPTTPLRLDAELLILVRTNPATGLAPVLWDHALNVLSAAEAAGATVTNPPAALRRFANKSGLLFLPQTIRPKTSIFPHIEPLISHIATLERAVIKPISGSQGAGVFIVGASDPNIRTAAELLLKTGPVMVQPWVTGAENGDIRMFLVDGAPLYLSGIPVTMARRPNGSELRSNVHLGATPFLSALTPSLQRIADIAGPVLREQGLRVAGLDCIGDSVIEINACAPGGLTDMSALAGVDTIRGFLDRLVATSPPH